MKMILGKKIGMTRVFSKDGESIPVTIIEVGQCVITQIKNEEKDGYEAVQIGYGKSKHIDKPMQGHFKKSKAKAQYLTELKGIDKDLKVGNKLILDNFKINDCVAVCAVSKGKGFAGVIKRHGFAGGPKSHGSDHHRAPGSIGGGYPQRVPKGKKMAGRMGGNRVTVKKLKIIQIDSDKNIIAISGSVPGPNGAIVEIRSL